MAGAAIASPPDTAALPWIGAASGIASFCMDALYPVTYSDVQRQAFPGRRFVRRSSSGSTPGLPDNRCLRVPLYPEESGNGFNMEAKSRAARTDERHPQP